MKAMKNHIFKTGILTAMLCLCLGCQTINSVTKPTQNDTNSQRDNTDWQPESKEEAEFWNWVYWIARIPAHPEQ
jgi:hypothetical protein